MKTIFRLIIIMVSGFVLFAFQNCSDPQFVSLNAPNLSKISGVETPGGDASTTQPNTPNIGEPPAELPPIYDDQDYDDVSDHDDADGENDDDEGDREDADGRRRRSHNICSLSRHDFSEAILNVKIKSAYLNNQNGAEVRVHTAAGQLLALSNGQIVISISSNAEAHELRLQLEDTGNTITSSSGVTYPLTTPSAQQSGIKINLKQSATAFGSFAANQTYIITFNIDLERQVVLAGRSGKCILQPVLFATKIETVRSSENNEVAAH